MSSPSRSAVMASMSAGVRRSPLRTTTSFWTMSTMTGSTPASAASRAVSVAIALNDEFGTTSGSMSSAASIRSASVRSPPIRPARRVRAWATSVSRSSVRSVASRTRAASPETTGQRSLLSPTSVEVAASVRSRTAVWRRSWRLSVGSSEANAASIRATRRS